MVWRYTTNSEIESIWPLQRHFLPSPPSEESLLSISFCREYGFAGALTLCVVRHGAERQSVNAFFRQQRSLGVIECENIHRLKYASQQCTWIIFLSIFVSDASLLTSTCHQHLFLPRSQHTKACHQCYARDYIPASVSVKGYLPDVTEEGRLGDK
ncbi:uncharacterized protein PHALS_10603 [Plasmopara halstedii]|uniref:Uncharacterized protein n=1 Tax=Plasmopara halstedii TaxID=4781 RepID=A0A0P1AH34_PLAHL|nr:uncharacterized protein PHALS_10603 [Plasmopara halstedii]CEG40400.1 hypothetical protein PHALS_10603 [Plasmopara halstedii]|eukprot:XP_024576769.1 hypothetical protein PHALS_10603 [Plasmopara halstedii]